MKGERKEGREKKREGRMEIGTCCQFLIIVFVVIHM